MYDAGDSDPRENAGLPFTLAHPIAAVPLARRGLVLSALVVGTLAPDFEYFLRLAPISKFSHTIAGLFVFCLPAGLLVLWAFHAVAKGALVHLLPVSHQRRLLPMCGAFKFGPPRRFALICLSVLLGAFTHVAWDSFTHSGAWAVREFPALSMTLLDTPYGPLMLYRLLQHGSTLFGLAMLTFLYIRWFRRAPAIPVHSPQLSVGTRLLIVSVIAVATVAASVTYAWLRFPPFAGFASFRGFVVLAGTFGISALAIQLALFSVCWRVVKARDAG